MVETHRRVIHVDIKLDLLKTASAGLIKGIPKQPASYALSPCVR